MNDFVKVIKYIVDSNQIPTKLESKTLIRITFLCDWKSTLEYGQPITNVKWSIRNFEPLLDKHSIPQLIDFLNMDSHKKNQKITGLNENEKKIIDWVIKSVSDKDETEISRLVYSTYPAFLTNEGEYADLVKLAKRYKDNFSQSKFISLGNELDIAV